MFKILVILCFVLLTLPCNVAAQTGNLNNRVYNIGGDDNFPPYEYMVEQDGVLAYRGFNVDIMKAIAIETGIEIEFHPMVWSKAVKGLDDGNLDMIQGMKYDKNRLSQYEFSQEYLVNSHALFVGKNSYISGLDDVKGKRIALQEGDIAHQQFKNNSAYVIVAVPSQADAFELLLKNEVAAVLCNKLAGNYILQRTNNLGNVKIVGAEINPERYCVAVRKGDKYLLDTINHGIVGIKRNGTYDKIYKKWFGETLDYPGTYYKEWLSIVLPALGALGLGVLFLGYVSYMLRKKVSERTAEISKINQRLIEQSEYIRQENLYKENILNSSYNGIVTIAKSGIIEFANSYAKNSFLEQLVGKDFRETPLRELLTDEFFNKAFMGRMFSNSERQIGFRNWYITVRVFSQAEEVESILLAFVDVTVEKQMRERLSRKDKMESLGNLVAGIAHEIKTPLTSIKTFSELISSKYDSPAFRETFCQYVPQEVERLNTIVNDLLDYSRQRPPFFTHVPLLQLVSSLLPFFKGRVDLGALDLKIAISETTKVYMDRQHLQQILINVLLNAIEAQKDCNKIYVKIYEQININNIVLVIEDSGPGIDMDSINKIFDPFFTTKISGTGLGLAISYQLARENKGDIWAENCSTGGARIYILLPTDRQEEEYDE